MPEFLTSHDLSVRTARAVAAATTAGREFGLAVTDPKVLHDMFSVVVHLRSSPVVVRVPTVLPPSLGADLARQAARQQAELDVVGWLTDHGHPVVAPSPLVPRRPVQQDGFSLTFWQLVEPKSDAEPDYVHNAALTAGLHAALRDCPVELPFLAPLGATIPRCLADLESRPDLVDAADLRRALREWEILEPVVGSRTGFEAAFPDASVQPIHGDSPPYNIISTAGGELYADFEDVSLGPVEWDLTLVGPEGVAAYNAAATRLGLRSLDEGVLKVMECARMLQVVACLALVPQMPALVEGLKPALEQWRAMPHAGDLVETA